MSTDSPSTTDRLAWIKRRLHLATPRDVGPREADFDAECRRLQTARLDLSVWAPLDIEYLLERLDTAEERLRKIASLQCDPTGAEPVEEARDLGWEDGYNAALAEVRHLAGEVLPEAIADRHYPQDLYLEFHEFPVASSKRTVCVECSGHPVPWNFDEASLVMWPCETAKSSGLGEEPSDV